MREKVQKIVEKIRPGLQADGGDIELVDVDEAQGIVKLKLKGACASCPMSQMTSYFVVEGILKKEVPEVRAVEMV